MRVIMFAVVAAAFVSQPAAAHWQWTRWGMTPEQVITASGGSAQRGDDELSAHKDQTKGATGTYASGEYSFKVVYWFKGAKLSMVDMTFSDSVKCPGLQRDLLAKYGEPVEYAGGSVERRMWRDTRSGNRVALINMGDFCDLQYSPLVSEGGAGL